MPNDSPVIVVRCVEEALEQDNLMRIVTLWINEEVAELRAADTSLARLDAVLDLTGICAMALALTSHEERSQAFHEFHRAQAARRRSFALPQMAVRALEAALNWDSQLGALANGARSELGQVLTTKALNRGWIVISDRGGE